MIHCLLIRCIDFMVGFYFSWQWILYYLLCDLMSRCNGNFHVPQDNNPGMGLSILRFSFLAFRWLAILWLRFYFCNSGLFLRANHQFLGAPTYIYSCYHRHSHQPLESRIVSCMFLFTADLTLGMLSSFGDAILVWRGTESQSSWAVVASSFWEHQS